MEVREKGRLGRSDHSMIVVELSVGPVPSKIKTGMPDWRRAVWEGIMRSLGDPVWQRTLVSKNVEEAWKALKNRVEDLVAKCVPSRRLRNQNRPPQPGNTESH